MRFESSLSQQIFLEQNKELETMTQTAKLPDQAAAPEKSPERLALEARFGENGVWNTDELREQFVVECFSGGFAFVVRKNDGQKGTLDFTGSPRLYCDFILAG